MLQIELEGSLARGIATHESYQVIGGRGSEGQERGILSQSVLESVPDVDGTEAVGVRELSPVVMFHVVHVSEERNTGSVDDQIDLLVTASALDLSSSFAHLFLATNVALDVHYAGIGELFQVDNSSLGSSGTAVNFGPEARKQDGSGTTNTLVAGDSGHQNNFTGQIHVGAVVVSRGRRNTHGAVCLLFGGQDADRKATQ